MHFPTKNIGGNFLCGKLGGGLSGGQTFSRYSFWTTPWVWQNIAIWMLFVQTCPTWITMFVLDPRETWRSEPSSNSRLSPLCHICRTPSLPAPCRMTFLLWQSLSAHHLFLVLLTLPIFLHLGAQNESIFDTPFLPNPNHLLLIFFPGSIPVLDHIAAKSLGSQSDFTPATAFCSSCPPSYE